VVAAATLVYPSTEPFALLIVWTRDAAVPPEILGTRICADCTLVPTSVDVESICVPIRDTPDITPDCTDRPVGNVLPYVSVPADGVREKNRLFVDADPEYPKIPPLPFETRLNSDELTVAFCSPTIFAGI
jgi:hypothetical protein